MSVLMVDEGRKFLGKMMAAEQRHLTISDQTSWTWHELQNFGSCIQYRLCHRLRLHLAFFEYISQGWTSRKIAPLQGHL